MSISLKTGFPDGISPSGAYVIRFTALSPVDGSVVSGVKVSNASVFTDSGEAVTGLLPPLPPVVLLPTQPTFSGTQVPHA